MVWKEMGKLIVRMREGCGFSQGDLAAKAGINRNYLSRIENGHVSPTSDTLHKLAVALNLEITFTAKGQNEFKMQLPKEEVTEEEKKLIKEWRVLVPSAKKTVWMVIEQCAGRKLGMVIQRGTRKGDS